MTDRCYDNPINKSNLAFWMFIICMGLALGFLLIIIEHGFPIYSVIIGGGIGTIVFIAVPWRMEFLWRPPTVEIVDTGVILHQRYWRGPRHIA